MSRNGEFLTYFNDPAYHGTNPDQVRSILLGGHGSLGMSTHGAAGSGIYVTGDEDEARNYGGIILSGTASADRVFTSRHKGYRELERHFNNPEKAPSIREHLIGQGFDAVEDATVKDAVALLHPRQFHVSRVYDPEIGHEMDALTYIDTRFPESAVPIGRRRRARASRVPVPREEQVWAPETFGK